MSKRRVPSLRHRGYLFAQTNLKRLEETIVAGYPDDGQNHENVSRRRMMIGEAWRAGYLAAQNDAKRKA